ncbi:MAG: hypothetical protein ACYS1B_12430, partial [Planctomycetota bacterium]
RMPGWRITSYVMLYACACLAGVPIITNGFWSKDAIMAEVFVTHGPGFTALGVIAVVTAFLTAYYTFRVWFRVCDGPVQYEAGEEHHGEHGGGGEFHPHAPRFVINFVLVALVIGAVGSIFCKSWATGMIEGSSAVGGVPVVHEADPEHAGFWSNPHTWMPWLAGTLGLVGIAIAWYFHRANRKAADNLRRALLANGATRWLPVAMENKWYVDELYHLTIRAPLWLFGRFLDLWDRYVVDMGLIDGVARLPRALGKGFQPLANGVLQSYAVSMVGGVVLVAVLVFVMPELIEWLRAMNGGAG